MWTLILTNWRLFAKAGMLIGAFMAGWYICSQFAEGRLNRALIQQAALLTEQCKKDKAITKEGNNALQRKYNNIVTKLNAHRMYGPSCIMPATGTPQPEAGRNGHAGANGISANWLNEYAAECERYRQERLTLEQFEAEVWKAKGQ